MIKATLQQPKGKLSPKKTKTVGKQFRTFRSAVNFLDSLTNYERSARTPYNANNFGLSRTNRLLAALGNPHNNFKTVHIAGTKGKGSTAAMLMEMLRGCGLKVGLYSSPHILNIRERILVDSEMVSEPDFVKLVSAVSEASAKARVAGPTYFDMLTSAAFLHFSQVGVDIAIIETGLGGRLDATNVITPEAIGITSISYDHLAQLGKTLPLIATEKAGIMKEGIPIISAPQEPEVRETLDAAASALNAPLKYSNENVDFSYRFEFSRTMGRHARICLTTPHCKFEHLHIPAPGIHQAINCTLALGLLDVLKGKGYPIDDQKAMLGVANLKLPGRMQLISEEPRIVVDGAHNGASIEALMRAVGQNIVYDSMVVIFGCSKEKDVARMVRQLQLGADKIIFTSIKSPRSADPQELAAEYSEVSGKMVQVAQDLEEALDIATRAISREDVICITGSFYLVAEAIRKFGRKS